MGPQRPAVFSTTAPGRVMRSAHFFAVFRPPGLHWALFLLAWACSLPALAAATPAKAQDTSSVHTTQQVKRPSAVKHAVSRRAVSQPAQHTAKRLRHQTSSRPARQPLRTREAAPAVRHTPSPRPVAGPTTDRRTRRVEAPVPAKATRIASAAPSARAADRFEVAAASTALNDDPVSLRSGSALVVDESTDRVLLSKNADTARPIASLTKLMTAAVILDAHQPMDQMIEITDADIDTLKWSSSRLRPGTRLSREELLKLALMSSENRAAHALARNYPGGLTAFVAAMNAKARALGMNSTRYVEPTGLSPQNESTAHDLALLVKAAYHYPLIREFSTHPQSEVDVGSRTLQFRNTDHLVFNRGWDILLQKTGYINEAGHCLVLQTQFEGRRIIVVLLDAWGRYSHFGDAQRIRNWLQAKGFDALRDPAQRDAETAAQRRRQPALLRTALAERTIEPGN